MWVLSFGSRGRVRAQITLCGYCGSGEVQLPCIALRCVPPRYHSTMAPVVPVSLAIIHTEVLMRMILCQVLERDKLMQVVLQLDSMERLRSLWPAGGAQVVLLHYCGAITLLLDSIRWLKRRTDPPAVLVLGQLTPHINSQLADVGAHALLQSATTCDQELMRAVGILAAGGVHPSAAEALRRAPRKLKQGSVQGEVLPPTDRQLEYLELVSDLAGLSRTAIADRMGISPCTVDEHRKALYRKFGVTTVGALIRFALDRGYVKRGK